MSDLSPSAAKRTKLNNEPDVHPLLLFEDEKASFGPFDAKEESQREPISDDEEPLSSANLYMLRCKTCAMCVQQDCGRCKTCCSNKHQTRPYREVCLRKMCRFLPKGQTCQRARGFPPGWKLYFHSPCIATSTSEAIREDQLGFYLISPDDQTHYQTCPEAIQDKKLDDVEGRCLLFYAQIGIQPKTQISDHPLSGQTFRREWINFQGTRLSLIGVIASVTRDFRNGLKFRIEYSRESRNFLNTWYNPLQMKIPANQVVDESHAWGGCIYNESKQFHYKPVMRETCPLQPRLWRVPDLYCNTSIHCEPAEDQGSVAAHLPQVIIHYNSFQLTFTVKASSQPNAGFGVYLSCKPLQNQTDTIFTLQPGEFLDFGVYAPFLPTDQKCDHEFIVKSFMNDFRCENYSFEAVDEGSVFDITCDETAYLHSKAAQHVPPYVNEANQWKTHLPEVHAMYDPQGALHYLLGYEEDYQRPFRFVADNVEREIYINYGERYESVRIREGYARTKNLSPKDRQAAILQEEVEYLEDMLCYTANEIESAIQVLVFCGTEKAKKERSFAVAILLYTRAKRIAREFADLPETKEVCANGAEKIDILLQSSTKLVESLVNDLTTKHTWKSLRDQPYFRCAVALALSLPQDSSQQLKTLDSITSLVHLLSLLLQS